MSLIPTGHVIESLATEWVRHFRRSPFVTLAASITAASIIVTIFFKIDDYNKEQHEVELLKDTNYKEQVTEIQEMEKSVNQLLIFLEQQKATLEQTESTIDRLKNEREKLKPLVDSDRQVVEAIFRVQENRANAGIWKERWIGFGLGIVASLAASFLWYVIIKLTRPNQKIGEQSAPIR